MAFNWFRRPNKDNPPPEPAETPTVEETPTPASSDAAVDYLQFAKAAYKNIQQKQVQAEVVTPSLLATETEASTPEIVTPSQVTTETDASTPEIVTPSQLVTETEASTPEIVTPSQLVTETDASTPEVVTPSQVTTEIDASNAAISDVKEIDTVAEIADVEPITLSTPVEVEPAAATIDNVIEKIETKANISFLERAAAERQARQERLNALAIVVPLESPLPTTEVEEIPGLAFDDGFLWSAEILAAQGRRPEDISLEEITWLKKLRLGLDKTRRSIVNQLKAIVGQGPLNQAAVMEIETLLLQADVGVEATDYIIDALQTKLRSETLPPDAAIAYLKKILCDMLDAPLQKSYMARFAPEKDTLTIWLVVGVNGAGKTTTIGKLAHLAQKSGYRCLIGAADTFRAAAVEQVRIWGERSGVEAIANPGKNTDPAAVVYDAIVAAQSRNSELLLVDTAGRLQNKKNLMEELSKIRRIIDKKAPNTKVESLLVLDATLGQNGLRQAEVFSQAAQLSGVVLTKLDGTAKGGIALAIVQQLGLPIRFIGAGEGIEDLRPFSSYEFVEALLSS